MSITLNHDLMIATWSEPFTVPAGPEPHQQYLKRWSPTSVRAPFPLAVEGGCVLHCSTRMPISPHEHDSYRFGTTMLPSAVALAEVMVISRTTRGVYVETPAPDPNSDAYMGSSCVAIMVDVTHLKLRYGDLVIFHPYEDVEPVFRAYRMQRELSMKDFT